MNLEELRRWAGCEPGASWEQVEQGVRDKCAKWAGASGHPDLDGLRQIAESRRGESERRVEELKQKGVVPHSPYWKQANEELRKWQDGIEALRVLKAADEFRAARQALRQFMTDRRRNRADIELNKLQQIASGLEGLFRPAYQEVEAEFIDAFGTASPARTPRPPSEGRPAAAPPPAPVPPAAPDAAAAGARVLDLAPTVLGSAPANLAAGAASSNLVPGGAAAAGSPPIPAAGATGGAGTPRPPDSLVAGHSSVTGLARSRLMFKRFTLVKKLGQGGMGVVWLARDESLSRDVAMKFLPDMLALNQGAVEDLKRETRRTLDLTHPCILRVYDFISDEENAALVMEYVDGETMDAMRARESAGVFSVEALRPWLAQFFDALEYAHEKGKIVHRDLKPANLMVSRRGELKIMDFGIARSISDSVSRLSHHRAASGTLAYMSPQQLMGEKPSVQDDVYGLGATLYDLLTRKPPFHTGDVATQIQMKVPPSMRERRQDLGIEGGGIIPPEWEETVAACLAKDLAHRPRSVAEVRQRLGLGAGAVAPPPPPPPPPAAEVKSPPAPPPPPTPRRAPPPPAPPPPAPPPAVDSALAALLADLPPEFPAESAPAAPKPAPMAAESVRVPVLPPLESVLVPTKPLEAGSAAGAPAGPQTAEVSGPPRVLQPSERWVNSLGMRFASVPDVGGLCAIWPVRLLDFETFARETGHDTGDQMWTLKRDGRNEREGNNWRKPGFIQGTDHPIVGVSWEDAQAFCRWLTDTERAQGVLAAGQTYRLPTDREWSLAAGLAGETGDSPMERSGPQQSLCPWGTGWPPTQTAGNYAGEEVREEEWPEEWPVIPGYQDGYPRTSPVGSFPPNAYGLYDLSGNVWEWCEDFYNGRSGARVLRGGSWANNTRDKLRWSARYYGSAGVRYDCYGFRVVLSLGAAAF